MWSGVLYCKVLFLSLRRRRRRRLYVFGSSVCAAVRASVRDSRGSFMFPRYLQHLLTDFRQTFATGASRDRDELIRFWGSKGQSSRSHHRGGGAQHLMLPSSATSSSLRLLCINIIDLCYFKTCDASCAADVLAADKQLANEIEFDLRKFEEQEKQQQKQQKSCNVAVSFCTFVELHPLPVFSVFFIYLQIYFWFSVAIYDRFAFFIPVSFPFILTFLFSESMYLQHCVAQMVCHHHTVCC